MHGFIDFRDFPTSLRFVHSGIFTLEAVLRDCRNSLKRVQKTVRRAAITEVYDILRCAKIQVLLAAVQKASSLTDHQLRPHAKQELIPD
jgi:hypothetical protein